MSKRLLLVEDESLIAMAGKMQLEKYGYSVHHVNTGEKAVQTIVDGTHPVDLILMDINLGPGIDGTQAAEQILNHKDIPVVFLSSHTEPETVEKTEKITSYGYVVKGSSITVLDASIKMAFKLFESRRLTDDIFTNSINGFCVHRIIRNKSGRIHDCEYLRVNSAFEHHTGLLSQDLIGRTIRDLYSGSEADEVIQLYDDALCGRADARQEFYFEPTSSWYEMSIFRTREDEFTVVVHNVTKRKHAEEALREINTLLKTQQETAPYGVLVVDENEKILSFNQVFADVWKIPDDIMARQSGNEALEFVLPLLPEQDEFVAEITALNKNQQTEEAKEIPLRDGRTLIRYSYPMISSRGDYEGRIWYYQDITDRKHAEEEIRRFKTISDNAVYGKAIVDLQGNLVYVNRFFANIHGYEPEELIGKHLSLFHNDHQIEAVERIVNSLIQEGHFNPTTVWHCHKDGTEFPMLMSGIILKDDNGNPQYLAASAVDITEQKRAEERLHLSERTYKEIFNAINGALFIHDIETGNIIDVNDTMLKMYGYSREEVPNLSVADLSASDEKYNNKSASELIKKAASGEDVVFEWLNKKKNGELFHSENILKCVMIAGQERIMAIVRDTTERKKTQKALFNTTEQLERIGEMARVGGWELDLATLQVDFSKEAARIHELDFPYVPPKLSQGNEFYPPEVWPDVQATVQAAIEHGTAYDREWPFITAKGNHIWVRVQGFCVKENGKPIKLQGTFQDITKRKRVEENLVQKSKLLEEAQLLANLGSWDWDIVHDTWHFSEQWKKIHGFSHDDIKTSALLKIAYPEDAPTIDKAFSEAKDEGKPYNIQHRIIRTDNNEMRWVHALGSVEYDQDSSIPIRMVGTVQDITDRKQAEEEIQRQLAEKETLFKEVHHRIKNNMAQVESLLSLQAASTENAEVKSALYEAMSRVGSIRELYEKLLIGKGYEEVSVKDYLESLIDSVAEVFNDRPGVTIEKKIVDFPLSPKTAVSVGIIINELLTNVFKYAFIGRDSGHILVELTRTDTLATLTITDDGVGIDTRDTANKSPGFGLTIVRMLVEQLVGTFTMENENGTRSVVEFEIGQRIRTEAEKQDAEKVDA